MNDQQKETLYRQLSQVWRLCRRENSSRAIFIGRDWSVSYILPDDLRIEIKSLNPFYEFVGVFNAKVDRREFINIVIESTTIAK